MLCLHEDGTTTIRHEGWWPKSGGSGENKMDSDYFRTHTMEEFISFLPQQHRNEHSPHKWDFSSLANREEIRRSFERTVKIIRSNRGINKNENRTITETKNDIYSR